MNEFEQQYFDTSYKNYDFQNPSYKIKFYKDLVEQYTPGEAPLVLDIGCAFGKFISSLKSNWKLFGSDMSSFAIGKAKKDFPNISFEISSAENIQFNESFDTITAFDTIEHVKSLEKLENTIKSKLSV